jgi:hypothetical protein
VVLQLLRSQPLPHHRHDLLRHEHILDTGGYEWRSDASARLQLFFPDHGKL